MHDILEAYAQPDRGFDDLRRSILGDQFPNKLRDFSEACVVAPERSDTVRVFREL
jgi:hypothetical protein